MSSTPFRALLVTTAAAGLIAAVVPVADARPAAAPPAGPPTAPPTAGPVMAARIAAAIVRENTTLLPKLYALGGRPSPDGRFVRLPGGTEISVVPQAFGDCPSGYLCLWSDASWSGRMTRTLGPNVRVNLVDAGLDNAMTSWANRSTLYDARWFYGANQTGTTRCMNVNTSSANVGTSDNDQASSIAVYTDAAAC